MKDYDKDMKVDRGDWLLIVIIAFIIALCFGCASIPPASSPTGPGGLDIINYCDEEKDQFNNTLYSYCIRKLVNGKRKEVLWFNHGAADNADVWNLDMLKKIAGMTNAPEKMKDFWNEWGDDAPTIISVSFGRVFMVTAYPNRTMRPQNATVEYFTGTVIPALEKKYSLEGRPRWIMGISQGGANTFTLASISPQLWSKAVLLNPMFNRPDCHPYDFINFNCKGLSPGASFLVQQNYQGRQHWDEWGVYGSAKKVLDGRLPQTYIQCDADDPWGFRLGVDKICAMLKLKNIDVRCEILPGSDHTHWDVKKVVEFLKQ